MAMAAFVAVLVSVVVAFWIGQRSLIYFPDRTLPQLSHAGLAQAEAVALETEDGLVLGGWFVPAPARTGGVHAVVFNGNAGNRGHRAELARQFVRRGIGVLLFDYRGYGGNPGRPSETGLRRDARAAVSYLSARVGVDPHRLVYFGESLGAAVAVDLAVSRPPAALVLRSPFSSLASMASIHFGVPAAPWLFRDRYASIEAIPKVTVPVLVIAGDRDGIVPLADSRMLFEAASEPKRLVVLSGADHNDAALTDGGDMLDAVAAWIGQP